jgi:hypothetical protein
LIEHIDTPSSPVPHRDYAVICYYHSGEITDREAHISVQESGLHRLDCDQPTPDRTPVLWTASNGAVEWRIVFKILQTEKVFNRASPHFSLQTHYYFQDKVLKSTCSGTLIAAARLEIDCRVLFRITYWKVMENTGTLY